MHHRQNRLESECEICFLVREEHTNTFRVLEEEVIPLEAWMSVCVYFVLSCVGSGLAIGLSPVGGVLPTLHKNHSFGINSEW
jgi:hypothetical protein